MAIYKVKPKQNIFDVAIELYGSIEGLFDLMITNTWLTMTTELTTNMELEYHEGFILNESIVSSMKEQNIVPANNERHVYYKNPGCDLIMICGVSEQLEIISFVAGGEGELIVDWGDNSELEYINLTHVNQTISHYFDNYVDLRRIRFYGDTSELKFTYLDTSELGGNLLPVRPIVVDEYVSHSNGFTLEGLFLFDGTYKVDLRKCVISSLESIADMDLQELNLLYVKFTNVSVIDEYLKHIAEHYGTRRACTVYLDTEPSEIGWNAINTIIGEQEWNYPLKWKFIINGITYTYTE
jgi:hypothetical protein